MLINPRTRDYRVQLCYSRILDAQTICASVRNERNSAKKRCQKGSKNILDGTPLSLQGIYRNLGKRYFNQSLRKGCIPLQCTAVPLAIPERKIKQSGVDVESSVRRRRKM